jgi:hypothetical protein
MTKNVRQLRADATDYRALADAFEGAVMKQALLETATALERLAEDLEDSGADYSRLV